MANNNFGLKEDNEYRLGKLRETINPVWGEDSTNEEYLMSVIHDLTFSPYLTSDLDSFDEQTAVERLIMEEIMFIGGDLKVRILCNDLFWWGCADSEDFEWKDIQPIWDSFVEHGYRGPLKWCCMKRNLRPQIPIVKRWKESGFWDEELEALPAPSKS